MVKKKFDLTTDIINNGLKTEIAAYDLEKNNANTFEEKSVHEPH